MKNEHLQRIYCRQCGGRIDADTMVCTQCGKAYFKFKPVHVFNVLICGFMILLSAAFIELYITHQNTLAVKEYYQSQATKLNSTVDELKEANERQAEKISDLQDAQEESACLVPSCDISTNYGSLYCPLHECAERICREKRVSDSCSYCKNHKCQISNCENCVEYGTGYYCRIHEPKL